MAILGKDAILSATDNKYAEVPVPEWGGEVRIRTLAAYERDNFEQSMSRERSGKRTDNLRNVRARLVVLCAVDEHGGRLFSRDDVEILGTKSAAALARLFEACLALNGMSDKDIDELTEGFDSAPSGSSVSD